MCHFHLQARENGHLSWRQGHWVLWWLQTHHLHSTLFCMLCIPNVSANSERSWKLSFQHKRQRHSRVLNTGCLQQSIWRTIWSWCCSWEMWHQGPGENNGRMSQDKSNDQQKEPQASCWWFKHVANTTLSYCIHLKTRAHTYASQKVQYKTLLSTVKSSKNINQSINKNQAVK